MGTKEDKLRRYLNDKMLNKIFSGMMKHKYLFTKRDLAEAYSKGYDEGYNEGMKEKRQELLARLRDEYIELHRQLNMDKMIKIK